MKHFVVINSWATEDNSDIKIVGIAHDMAEAKEIFASAIDEEKQFASENNWHIEEDTDKYFEAYEEGYYASAHTVLYIQEI